MWMPNACGVFDGNRQFLPRRIDNQNFAIPIEQSVKNQGAQLRDFFRRRAGASHCRQEQPGPEPPKGYDRPVPFLLRILVGWAIDAASLAVAAWIFSGISVGGSAGTLILAALVYGILATFVKPMLKLLTLPLAVLTLGIAWFFVAMFSSGSPT